LIALIAVLTRKPCDSSAYERPVTDGQTRCSRIASRG